MKKIINKAGFIAAVFLLLSINACTDLDENLYSEIPEDKFYKNRREIMQAVLRPFTHMQAWLAPSGQSGYYYHSAMSGDQLAWPQKGKHGYDGGDHIRMHYHTWTADEGRLRDAWNLMWTGVGFLNSTLEDFEKVDFESIGISEEEKASFTAEVKVLRAYHYLRIMDMWGNVPIVTNVADPLNAPTASREEVFNFVKEELEANVDLLPPLSQETLGRVSMAAGYAMLAELYLNAEVWSGTPMWDECIAACDKIIGGETGGLNGAVALDEDILTPFNNTNHLSKENLFQFAYSRKGGFTFDWGGFFMGYSNMSEALNVGYSGWNAFVVIPSAFDAFQESDLRRQEWFLFGPQYKYGTKDPILGTEEWNGKPLVYVNTIRRESEGDLSSDGGMTEGEENSGARFHKYRSGTLDDENYWENDYVIYRLTEIYFNKAEAIMRKNGGTATPEAVELINTSRQRAFAPGDWADAAYTTATLDLDELLAERGREFVFEGKRRTDLIRFGKFTTENWWDHEPSGETKALFPIPSTQIASNPNLVQNPGY